jgi:2'-5' RNA ligase
MKRRVIVYWLMPAKSERELFRKLVRILAREFNAPLFEPHMTLFSVPEDRIHPKRILQTINVPPIRLQIRGIAFSPKYTKTLFVRFGSNKSLEKLVVNIANAVKTRAKAPRDPHVSLVYKKLTSRMKRELASAMKFPIREVLFDAIKAVRSNSPTETAADVKAWRVLATRQLSA